MATAVKRKHEPPKIVGDLLTAEIRENDPVRRHRFKPSGDLRARSTIARLPLAKEIDKFDFEETAVIETLIRDLATGDVLDHQRNLVLIGVTGTGKSHLPSALRAPASGAASEVASSTPSTSSTSSTPRPALTIGAARQICSVASTCPVWASDQWRPHAELLDELGYLPFAQTGGHLFAIGLQHMATRRITPSDRQALRAHLDHRGDQPGIP